MRRREFIALLGGATAAVPYAAGAGPAHATGRISERLVGAWRFVASVNTRDDGSTFDRWGQDAKGSFMFDGHGHFSQIIMGSESRMFGAKTFFAYGTYSVDEAGRTVVTQIEGSSVSKLNGIVQRRTITVLTADELRYLNATTASGMMVNAHWKRMK
jgi:hypothetical protein